MTQLKNLTFESIQRDADSFSHHSTDSYLVAYPEFLQFFAEIEKIERKHLIIGSHFVYGWMPTILKKFNIENEASLLEMLNHAKNGEMLNNDQLRIIRSCVNNSMVGASKLLHFINPTHYAIWDSRIFRYSTGKKSLYGIKRVGYYQEYLFRLREISMHQGYGVVHHKIEAHLNMTLPPMRAIEIIMFQADRNKAT